MEDVGISVNAAWIAVSALNVVLLVGVVLLLSRLVRWILGGKRREAELASLRERVSRLEVARSVEPTAADVSAEPPGTVTR